MTGDGANRATLNRLEQSAELKSINAAIENGPELSLDGNDAQRQLLLPDDHFLALRDRKTVSLREFFNEPVIAATGQGG